jgi:acyl carrier protein
MDRQEIFTNFQTCVAEVLDIQPREILPDARWLDDLGADSLDVIEITLALQDAFSVDMRDVRPEELETVGQAFDLLVRLVGV